MEMLCAEAVDALAPWAANLKAEEFAEESNVSVSL